MKVANQGGKGDRRKFAGRKSPPPLLLPQEGRRVSAEGASCGRVSASRSNSRVSPPAVGQDWNPKVSHALRDTLPSPHFSPLCCGDVHWVRRRREDNPPLSRPLSKSHLATQDEHGRTMSPPPLLPYSPLCLPTHSCRRRLQHVSPSASSIILPPTSPPPPTSHSLS